MLVLICGGRDYAWTSTDTRRLDALHAHFFFTEILVGTSPSSPLRGVDMHAYLWARDAGVNRTAMDANWVGHGKAGGFRRNTRMLEYLCLMGTVIQVSYAVIAWPGHRGTADMVRQALRRQVPVYDYAGNGMTHPEHYAGGTLPGFSSLQR